MIISSKEYANNIEDVLDTALYEAIASTYSFVMREYKLEEDYYIREENAMKVADELLGELAELRDKALGVFERYGMSIESDGMCF